MYHKSLYTTVKMKIEDQFSDGKYPSLQRHITMSRLNEIQRELRKTVRDRVRIEVQYPVANVAEGFTNI